MPLGGAAGALPARREGPAVRDSVTAAPFGVLGAGWPGLRLPRGPCCALPEARPGDPSVLPAPLSLPQSASPSVTSLLPLPRLSPKSPSPSPLLPERPSPGPAAVQLLGGGATEWGFTGPPPPSAHLVAQAESPRCLPACLAAHQQHASEALPLSDEGTFVFNKNNPYSYGAGKKVTRLKIPPPKVDTCCCHWGDVL